MLTKRHTEGNTVAILCAERHPSRCHRLLISNWLAAHDVTVDYIIVNNKGEIELVPHKLRQWGVMPIIEDDGEIVYPRKQRNDCNDTVSPETRHMDVTR